jgi:large subunit ribosomal protein L24
MHIKKNDVVVVLIGDDAGKTGPVIDISHKKGKVKVQNVAVVTCHAKARQRGKKSGVNSQESWINASNVKRI